MKTILRLFTVLVFAATSPHVFADGETYFVAVRHEKIQFNPSSRVVIPDDDAADIDFIGDTK